MKLAKFAVLTVAASMFLTACGDDESEGFYCEVEASKTQVQMTMNIPMVNYTEIVATLEGDRVKESTYVEFYDSRAAKEMCDYTKDVAGHYSSVDVKCKGNAVTTLEYAGDDLDEVRETLEEQCVEMREEFEHAY